MRDEKPTPDHSAELRDEINASFEAYAHELVWDITNEKMGTSELTITNIKLEEIVSWQALQDVLKVLGFDIEADEGQPWRTLGMSDEVGDFNGDTSNLLFSHGILHPTYNSFFG